MKVGKHPSPYNQINIGEKDEMIIEGYIFSYPRMFLFWLAVFCSCGVLLVIIAWKPSIYIKLSHLQFRLDQADKIILKVRLTFYLTIIYFTKFFILFFFCQQTGFVRPRVCRGFKKARL